MSSDFTADLDGITGGMSVGHYANDDEEFNDAVSQMVGLGHGRKKTIAALTKWINETPTWDCAECGTENIEVAGWADCPQCDTPNPEVVTISHRTVVVDGADVVDRGGFSVTTQGVTIDYTMSAAQTRGVASDCPECGATITDWTGGKDWNDKPNHVQHVRFHASLDV